MKKWLFIPFTFALLLVTSCTPAPTPTVMAQLSPTPAALVTVTPIPTSATATLMPVPTNTLVPPTVAPLPTITPTPLPTPPGQIFFAWHSDDGKSNILYRAMPANSADDWQIIPVIEDVVPSRMRLSPDQSKLAFMLRHDTNGDGELTTSGYEADLYDIFIYDLLQNEIWQLPNTRQHVSPVWVSDNQSIVSMSNDNEIVNTFLDGRVSETFLSLPHHGGSLSISPDGKLLLFAMRHDDSNRDKLYAYDRDTGETTILQDSVGGTFSASTWNSTGEWWAYGDGLVGNVFVLNRETLEFIPLTPDSWGARIDWSLDGNKLAFTKDRKALHLWYPDTLSSDEILTAEVIHAFFWSPQADMLAVLVTQNEEQKIIIFDPNSGETHVLLTAMPEQDLFLHDWSSAGEWLAISLQEYSERPEVIYSDIHVLHVKSGTLHLVKDSIGGLPRFLRWVPTPSYHDQE